MAKKRDTSRGSRPRRPKRIISGITEFIDDNWWEDSRRPSRDKKRKTSDKSVEQDTTSIEKQKSEKAKPAAKSADTPKPAKKKTTQTKKEPAVKEEIAEPKAQPKRKRSRRRKKSEPVVEANVKQEPVVQEADEAAPKKKRRRRSKRRVEADKTPTIEAAPEQPSKQEEPSIEKPKRRRRRSAKKEPVEAPRDQSSTKQPPREEKLPEEPATKPKRRRRKVKAETEEKPREEKVTPPKQKLEAEAEEAPRPKRKKATAKKKKAASQKEPLQEAKETPTEKKPAAEKRSPKKKRRVPKKTGFEAMDLSEELLEALSRANYTEPTPIQAGLIPEALKGIDLMGQAQTGTGKTAAFAIPLLEMVDFETEYRGPQALVLVPTRELAVQVRDECAKLADTSDIQVVAVYGGKPIRRQIEKLRRAPEIVVGTPGRVIDLNARGALFFGDLHQVVLDEADRMLDIGFRPDIEKILRRCPESRQTLLLSATLPDPVLRLAKRYMRDPEVLDFSPKNIAVETIDQFYFTVDQERKFDLLLKLLERENPTQAIVFCRTRRGTEKIYRRLSRQKLESVACIHGDLTQSTRDTTMRKFRDGKLRILVATDVVGRGIDVSGVSHIINYDIPEFCDDYVHRVGRTGRMGREGVAYSFITPAEGPELTRIEMRINLLLQRAEMPGFDMGLKEETMEEDAPPSTSKPVYGRPTHRIRRAL